MHCFGHFYFIFVLKILFFGGGVEGVEFSLCLHHLILLLIYVFSLNYVL
jgi:hypothetical protein